jgi:hypothetical protein
VMIFHSRWPIPLWRTRIESVLPLKARKLIFKTRPCQRNCRDKIGITAYSIHYVPRRLQDTFEQCWLLHGENVLASSTFSSSIISHDAASIWLDLPYSVVTSLSPGSNTQQLKYHHPWLTTLSNSDYKIATKSLYTLCSVLYAICYIAVSAWSDCYVTVGRFVYGGVHDL